MLKFLATIENVRKIRSKDLSYNRHVQGGKIVTFREENCHVQGGKISLCSPDSRLMSSSRVVVCQ